MMSDPKHDKNWSRKRFLQVFGLGWVALGLLMLAASRAFEPRALSILGGIFIAVGALWLICARYASNRDEPMRAPQRRYVREFLPAMLAYMIVLFTVIPILKHVDAAPLKALLALLPVVPVAFAMRAMLRLLLASDELEQKQQLEAISISAMTVTLLSFAAGFLQTVDLFPIKNPLMMVLPAMFGVYGVALAWVKRKYRGD